MGIVSTHSRPKAAGSTTKATAWKKDSFNTQPPEGGWGKTSLGVRRMIVSTHSRPKAAGNAIQTNTQTQAGFQHTAARKRLASQYENRKADTLFQHTAARRRLGFWFSQSLFVVCFNTQPPEGGWKGLVPKLLDFEVFQHTAARRRLELSNLSTTAQYGFNTQPPEGGWDIRRFLPMCLHGFNTQPPEGGWDCWDTIINWSS